MIKRRQFAAALVAAPILAGPLSVWAQLSPERVARGRTLLKENRALLLGWRPDLRSNQSDFFGLAVGLLSDRIAA